MLTKVLFSFFMVAACVEAFGAESRENPFYGSSLGSVSRLRQDAVHRAFDPKSDLHRAQRDATFLDRRSHRDRSDQSQSSHCSARSHRSTSLQRGRGSEERGVPISQFSKHDWTTVLAGGGDHSMGPSQRALEDDIASLAPSQRTDRSSLKGSACTCSYMLDT